MSVYFIDVYNLFVLSKKRPLQLQEKCVHSNAPQQVPTARTSFPRVSVLHCVSLKLDKHSGTRRVFIQGLAHKPLVYPEI